MCQCEHAMKLDCVQASFGPGQSLTAAHIGPCKAAWRCSLRQAPSCIGPRSPAGILASCALWATSTKPGGAMLVPAPRSASGGRCAAKAARTSAATATARRLCSASSCRRRSGAPAEHWHWCEPAMWYQVPELTAWICQRRFDSISCAVCQSCGSRQHTCYSALWEAHEVPSTSTPGSAYNSVP